uniref:Putative Efflux transporter, RND family, MFP subunit n=1 Tax=Magnetococcus massalia (strain MO-1) TaxID=451514 RepID=A0A1S7LID8_MAGMO|nr:putative Efflux transporter, RND family, MFP subunit [Candidatus Magnetococcus massalia]
MKVRFVALVRGLFIPLLILLLGGLAIRWIGSLEREPKAAVSFEATPRVVLQPIAPQSEAPWIYAHGVVKAGREVKLMPRVKGEVKQLGSAFRLGSQVGVGTLLLELDETDYRLKVEEMESRLASAQHELEIETGRGRVAKRDYRMLDGRSDTQATALALRKPQLGVAKAKVTQARVQLKQAREELARTRIRAPFSGLLVEKTADKGQWLNAGQQFARLVADDHFLIHLSLTQRQLVSLQGLPLKGAAGRGIAVQLRSATAGELPWHQGRQGYLDGLLGEVDGKTRMATLLVKLPQPLTGERMPLLPGAYVEARFKGQVNETIYPIPARALHRNNTIWTVVRSDDGHLTLASHLITPQWQEGEILYAEIASLKAANSQLVISPLSLPLNGMTVSTEPNSAKPPASVGKQRQNSQDRQGEQGDKKGKKDRGESP